MIRATVYCAPHGSGKGLKAEALRERFDCTRVIDDWWPRRSALVEGALHLTHALPEIVEAALGPSTAAEVRIVGEGW